MEHRVTITYDGRLGEDLADRLMGELLERAGDAGPVISEGAGEFTIVLAFDARDLQTALAQAIDVGRGALHAVGIGGEPCGAEVELVDDHEPAPITS